MAYREKSALGSWKMDLLVNQGGRKCQKREIYVQQILDREKDHRNKGHGILFGRKRFAHNLINYGSIHQSYFIAYTKNHCSTKNKLLREWFAWK